MTRLGFGNRLATNLCAICTLLFVIFASCENRPNGRPQDPVPPYGYYTEEVEIKNEQANVTLAGTLTMPSKEGKYPAVILISGSGPQDRNSEFAGHRPFLVLADYLTKEGIAVLRYDDRGVGQSTGNFGSATSLDFSFDVESAVQYLKTRNEVEKNKIGLVGHSDGAMIAPMVAARSGDVSFVVLLAGPGVPGPQLLLDRQELVERKMGLSEVEIGKSREHANQLMQIVINSPDTETKRNQLTEFSRNHYDDIPEYAIPPGMAKDDYIRRHIEMLCSPWFGFFLTYDPASTLREVKCPVLALNGEKDVQVPAAANLEGIRHALVTGGNQNVTTESIPELNHAFQECGTGMVDEYGKIEQTFAPVALSKIAEWVLKQAGR